MEKLCYDFYHRPCEVVARDLVGKVLVRRVDGQELRLRITETECYCGEEDTACHAHKGKTERTKPMYESGGITYVYLCYGMHWLMNVITGEEEQPQGVLFRAGEGFNGPGKLTKALGVTGEQNKQSFVDNDEIWIEDDGQNHEYHTDTRVGIAYATEEYREKQWRFVLN